jgi:hypothetical protein
LKLKKKLKNNFFFIKKKIVKKKKFFCGIPQKKLKFRFLPRKMDFPRFTPIPHSAKFKNIPWNSARGIRFLPPSENP